MNLLQRTRREKLPPHTLVVTRISRKGKWPIKYGNPYVVDLGANFSVRWVVKTNVEAVAQHREWLWLDEQKPLREEFIAECIEKGIENLACFCSLGVPCHRNNWNEVWMKYCEAKNG